jgi:hypothetical protein
VRLQRSPSVLLAAGALAVTLALAPGARAGESEAYKAHMAGGAKLVEDENFAAARAEFEAAYQAEPRARPLLDMALCDRAMFRYPQAIAALERALRDHGATLDEGERKAAEASLAELRALLGFVQVELVPKDALLRIDGEDQPRGALQRTIPLGPGAHRLEARLDGYWPAAQTITLAAGDQAAIKLRLVTTSAPPPLSSTPEPPAPRGPYVLAAVTGFVPVQPTDFSGAGAGISGGARIGYRLASVVGVEAGIEYAHVGVSGQGKPSFADLTTGSFPLHYSLSIFRVGANVRLMTTGSTIRFVQTFGGGVSVDAVSWEPGSGSHVTRQDANGADAYGMSETGFELDLRSVLLGLTAQNVIASSGALTHPQHTQFSASTYDGPQFSIGLGLRAGYRLW